MITVLSVIFVLFFSGTILSGWLLYQVIFNIELAPRDWDAKICTMSECK